MPIRRCFVALVQGADVGWNRRAWPQWITVGWQHRRITVSSISGCYDFLLRRFFFFWLGRVCLPPIDFNGFGIRPSWATLANWLSIGQSMCIVTKKKTVDAVAMAIIAIYLFFLNARSCRRARRIRRRNRLKSRSCACRRLTLWSSSHSLSRSLMRSLFTLFRWIKANQTNHKPKRKKNDHSNFFPFCKISFNRNAIRRWTSYPKH